MTTETWSTSGTDPQPVRLTQYSHGGGCACKMPLGSLEAVLGDITWPASPHHRVVVGAEEADDAAVLALDDRRGLVVTTDFFTPIVDDPRQFGSIAAANALSDVYAMGGAPALALNIAAWPQDSLGPEMLAEVLRGGAETASKAGCVVGGGHTIDDAEPKYGMAVVGFVDLDAMFRIDAARPGDVLVLTKPLGTGVIGSGIKAGLASSTQAQAAYESMTRLNATACDLAHDVGARAVTDVTGYGLIGHLMRMCRASSVAADVDVSAVELLPGVEYLIGQGCVSGGTRRNIDYSRADLSTGLSEDDPALIVLHDAQTSGGLLICVPPESASMVPEQLEGHTLSVVGAITPAAEHLVRLG